MKPEIIKFKEMEAGKTYETYCLVVKTKEKIAKNAATYVEFELCDGESTIVARQFNCNTNELFEKGVEPETIIRACVSISLYNGNRSYIIMYASKLEDTILTMNDFVMKAPIDLETAFSELLELVEESHIPCELDYFSTPLTELTISLLKANKGDFIKSSAAKSIHHNEIGGLLQHTLTMVKQAKKILDIYPELDEELLICGAALHDIGKIKEMETSKTGHAEYTLDGRLLGHAMIGIMMVEKASSDVYDEERVRMLQHMIAAHHGLPEYGTISQAAIREALVLHAIDMIDSKMYVFNNAYERLSAGSLSQNIFALNGKTVYKPYPIGIGEKNVVDVS